MKTTIKKQIPKDIFLRECHLILPDICGMICVGLCFVGVIICL